MPRTVGGVYSDMVDYLTTRMADDGVRCRELRAVGMYHVVGVSIIQTSATRARPWRKGWTSAGSRAISSFNMGAVAARGSAHGDAGGSAPGQSSASSRAAARRACSARVRSPRAS